MPLTPVQVRILGCLVEKERATPDAYPLTMKGLLAACNQTTGRYPVVSLTEATVANAVANLRAENLLRIDFSRSNRAERYRHVLGSAYGADDAELAVLAVLMLRGPQTAGELRTRAERLHPFASQAEIDGVLARLAGRPEPLVSLLDRAAGQKEPRWAHLLAGPPSPDAAPAPPVQPRGPTAERLEALEAVVADLRARVARLEASHDALAALVRRGGQP